MKYKARKVPYSSIVGQSVTIHDETGAVVAQVAIMVPLPGTDRMKVATDIADAIVNALGEP